MLAMDPCRFLPCRRLDDSVAYMSTLENVGVLFRTSFPDNSRIRQMTLRILELLHSRILGSGL